MKHYRQPLSIQDVIAFADTHARVYIQGDEYTISPDNLSTMLDHITNLCTGLQGTFKGKRNNAYIMGIYLKLMAITRAYPKCSTHRCRISIYKEGMKAITNLMYIIDCFSGDADNEIILALSRDIYILLKLRYMEHTNLRHRVVWGTASGKLAHAINQGWY